LARNTKRKLEDASPLPNVTSAPKEVQKHQFARNLYRRLLELGWNQSDLARAADIGRDRVSVYVRGITFPEPVTLQKIADALECKAEDLAPSITEAAIADELPAVELRQSLANPQRAWLRVNREVTFATAAKVIAILEADTTQH
jgi:transcriptional regulator with XRE-family HTH domain